MYGSCSTAATTDFLYCVAFFAVGRGGLFPRRGCRCSPPLLYGGRKLVRWHRDPIHCICMRAAPFLSHCAARGCLAAEKLWRFPAGGIRGANLTRAATSSLLASLQAWQQPLEGTRGFKKTSNKSKNFAASLAMCAPTFVQLFS